jgi:hypothetical protein
MARAVDDADRIERGTLAGMARAEMHHRVDERTERLLTSLVGRHRANQLSGDDAKAGIAALSEMRLLLDDVERDVRQGEEARERLHTSPSPH